MFQLHGSYPAVDECIRYKGKKKLQSSADFSLSTIRLNQISNCVRARRRWMHSQCLSTEATCPCTSTVSCRKLWPSSFLFFSRQTFSDSWMMNGLILIWVHFLLHEKLANFLPRLLLLLFLESYTIFTYKEFCGSRWEERKREEEEERERERGCEKEALSGQLD